MEVCKKFAGLDLEITTTDKKIKIVDSKSLNTAIEAAIAAKQPFLQLEAVETAPKEEPKKEEPKEEPKQEAKEDKKNPPEQPKAAPKKEEQPPAPKKEERKEEPKKEEQKKEQPASTGCKFCPNCGTPNPGKFCSNCGNKCDAAAPAAPAAQQPKEEHRPTTPPPSALDETDTLCGECGKPVAGGIKALNKYWHDECFVCSVCRSPFKSGMKLMQHEGKPICEKCYDETCVPRCFKCGKPLTGKYLIVDGHDYHSDCFVCTKCGNPFTSSYLIVNGQPICKKCA